MISPGKEKQGQKKSDAKPKNRPSRFRSVLKSLGEAIRKGQKDKNEKEPEYFSWAVDSDDR